eukprot:3941930-Rhodomonas_salina.16
MTSIRMQMTGIRMQMTGIRMQMTGMRYRAASTGLGIGGGVQAEEHELYPLQLEGGLAEEQLRSILRGAAARAHCPRHVTTAHRTSWHTYSTPCGVSGCPHDGRARPGIAQRTRARASEEVAPEQAARSRQHLFWTLVRPRARDPLYRLLPQPRDVRGSELVRAGTGCLCVQFPISVSPPRTSPGAQRDATEGSCRRG